MFTLRSEDRASLCTFTFADGRRCRTPRHPGHPHLCYFHARKEAQALAAEQAGRDISACLSSGRYLSACNLSIALARLFSAVAQGHIKPKTANTLAYLGQTLLQTIRLAQHEYINAFDTDAWRSASACPCPDLRGVHRAPQRVYPNRCGVYPALRVNPDLRGIAPRPPRVPRTPGSNPLPKSGAEFYAAVCKLANKTPP